MTMITITEDEDFGSISDDLVGDFLSTLENSDGVKFTKNDVYAVESFGDSLQSVVFRGTNLTAEGGGTITGMSFLYTIIDDEHFPQYTASGFQIKLVNMTSAVDAATQGDNSALKALFEGLDWHFKAPGTAPVSFDGTGGDDVFISTQGNDQYHLDGGNDKVLLGAGDDRVDLDNLYGYQAPGLSHINGGAGFDTLDFSTEQAGETLTHGLVINLNKNIDLGAFDINVKNFEEVIGSKFADNITGTNGDDILMGGGGGDTLTGGRGADYLIGSSDAHDTFVYHNVNNSPAGNGRDIIVDFESNRDVIDLSPIDLGSQHHKFHYTDGPLKDVGDIRFVQHDMHVPELNYTMIQAIIDPDEGIGFEIKVMGLINGNEVIF
jgi:Ca2+-binding RTX toxin-like protein